MTSADYVRIGFVAGFLVGAARRDEMPQDDCGALLEQLRG